MVRFSVDAAETWLISSAFRRTMPVVLLGKEKDDVALKRRKRVLIVDDEAMVRDLLADVLSDAGYQAVIAPTWKMGETGFDEIGYSLVITDMFMPDRDGIEVIQDVKKRWPEVKILAISGGWGNTTPKRAANAATEIGATATMQKPFSPKDLLAMVEELIGEA